MNENFIPDLLKFADGRTVDASNWEQRRLELINILSREEYGITPISPKKVFGEVFERDEKCCAGHAVLERINISFDAEKGIFGFPMHFFAPTDGKKHPLILMMNFRPDIYDMSYPAEEIIDNGFALGVVCYKDVTNDDNDFNDKISSFYSRDENTGWGKISMWAFALSRALDYLIERPEIDSENIAVCGHSRLGKTALWCGAQDTRIKYVYSNDSGCSGAAYERTKHEDAETIAFITKTFPQWFCKNYQKYADTPNDRPFDQHFLLAAIAPRYLLVGSADQDTWADPYSEQLCCVAAGTAWKLNGLAGFCGSTKKAKVGEQFLDGGIGYHLRDGTHYFSRRDWVAFMNFIKKHM